MKKNVPVVYAKLPNAGLGNMLFVWARALVFAHINNAKFVYSGWKKLRLKTIFKTRKLGRFYSFFEKGNQISNISYWFLKVTRKKKLIEPSFLNNTEFNLATFNKIPHWDDYFKDIKEYNKLISIELRKIIKNDYLTYLNNVDKPLIGVHIRMGDFKRLLPNQDFKETGGVRTPLFYFNNIINQIRLITGKNTPVTIFSDGNKTELIEIFNLGNINFAQTPNEITDLMLLSHSKIIITSAGSTFGYWAGFLSNAILIMHPDHIHASIRSNKINDLFYEGAFDTNNKKLVQLINEIL